MAIITVEDPRFKIYITHTGIEVTQLEVVRFLEHLVNLQVASGFMSLAVEIGPTEATYTLTAVDARTYVAIITLATRARAITSSAFTLAELLSNNPLVESVLDLIDEGMTDLDVTL